MVLLIALVSFLTIQKLDHTLHTSEQIYPITHFTFNHESVNFLEQTVPEKGIAEYEYEATISGENLQKMVKDEEGLALVITRLRGNWHRIFLNGMLIGEVGNESNLKQNIWNNAYIFYIDQSLIQSSNVLAFKTVSEYKIGFGNIPAFLAGANTATELYTKIKQIHSPLYVIVISAMLALATMEVLLFGFTKYYDHSYGLFPFCVIAISIYLMDYTVCSFDPLSPLVFKKICLMGLHTSMIILAVALSRRYKNKMLLITGVSTYILSFSSICFAPDLISLSKIYPVANVLLIFNVALWFLVSLVTFVKERYSEDLMIAVASLLLLVPSTFDIMDLLFGSGYQKRIAVYGVIFYGTAILIIGMFNFIDAQKSIYHKTKQLAEDKERLAKALMTDDLTGLPNHRHFFECFDQCIEKNVGKMAILFIDIDKFRAINNTFGHISGDQILQGLAKIIVDQVHDHDSVFRYGGEEFVALLEGEQANRSQEVAEGIRQEVVKSLSVAGLNVRYPVTVSIGIAVYPTQSVEPRQVVSKAEKANEFAKLSGRNRVSAYEKSIERQLEEYSKEALRRDLLTDFVITLAAAIDLKDVYTGRHSEEVAHYALMISDVMQLNDEQRYALKMGSILHDLGKIAIPDAILRKTDRLDEEEYAHIQRHTLIGANLIKEIVNDDEVLACVRHHHERMDGKGYPDGLEGNQIPLLARIVCIADAYHAMVSTRSYREGMPKQLAVEQLEKCSGTQFDADIVRIFIPLLEQEGGG